jgi:putative ABC transport system permease protein
VRALDLTLDASVLWVGVALAMIAAVLLAFVPRLPASDASKGFVLSSGSPRMSSAATRKLRAFAAMQVAASFILLAGAGMLILTLLALQARRPGFETTNLLTAGAV